MTPDRMSTHDAPPQFGVGKSIAFSIVTILLALTLAECGVRGWAWFLREKAQKYDPALGTFVLVPGEHRTELGVVEINADGFPGRPLEPPGADLHRVLSIGDSCTFGGGDDRHTYPAMLDARLRARNAPGLRFEVVNGGISGMDSELVLNRLRAVGAGLAPKVVMIYVGWNDLMKMDPAGQMKRGTGSALARALDSLWLAKGLRKLLFFYVRPRVRPPRTGPSSHSGRFTEFRPTYFEENLRAIVDTVRGLGAKPLLVTLPTVARIEMTTEDVLAAHVVFPYFPTAYGIGDLLDLLSGYNRVVREVGGAMHVPVVPLAEHFESLSDPRPFFYDTMHTNEQGMAIIASELERGLDAAGLLPATASGLRP